MCLCIYLCNKTLLNKLKIYNFASRTWDKQLDLMAFLFLVDENFFVICVRNCNHFYFLKVQATLSGIGNNSLTIKLHNDISRSYRLFKFALVLRNMLVHACALSRYIEM